MIIIAILVVAGFISYQRRSWKPFLVTLGILVGVWLLAVVSLMSLGSQVSEILDNVGSSI